MLGCGLVACAASDECGLFPVAGVGVCCCPGVHCCGCLLCGQGRGPHLAGLLDQGLGGVGGDCILQIFLSESSTHTAVSSRCAGVVSSAIQAGRWGCCSVHTPGRSTVTIGVLMVIVMHGPSDEIQTLSMVVVWSYDGAIQTRGLTSPYQTGRGLHVS